MGPKPIIYGSIAARINNIKSVINAPIGMGFVFLRKYQEAKSILFLKAYLNTHNGNDKKIGLYLKFRR